MLAYTTANSDGLMFWQQTRILFILSKVTRVCQQHDGCLFTIFVETRPKTSCDELRAGVGQTLGVFPKPAAFLQPSERAFDDPVLGNDREGVQFAPFGDLHRGPDQIPNGGGKRLARVAAIHLDQHKTH